MYDVDYKRWADYIESIFQIHGQAPSLVLDLGCGTGSFCIEMARRGYEMIGVDSSIDMLTCAKSKLENSGLDILFLNQNMSEFELYGTVDAVVCLMDSFNYLIRKTDAANMLKLVRNYLNPGGLFIFDINTEHKLKNSLGNNVFYDIGDDISYIWQSNFDSRKRLGRFDITFFVREGELYRRYDEVHNERAYSMAEIEHMLGKSGLSLINVYDELCFKPANEKSERVFFICIKEEKIHKK